MSRYLTPAQAADSLQCGVKAVYSLIASRAIKASNIGTKTKPRWRITSSAIDDFLSRRAAVSPAAGRRAHVNLPAVQEIVS